MGPDVFAPSIPVPSFSLKGSLTVRCEDGKERPNAAEREIPTLYQPGGSETTESQNVGMAFTIVPNSSAPTGLTT